MDLSWSEERHHGLKLWQAALVIFLLGLTLRSLVLWKNHPIIVGGDEPEYVALAETLGTEWKFVTAPYIPYNYQGGKPGDATAYRSPVLPFVLAMHFKVFGHSLLFPRITLVIISSLISVVLIWIGRVLAMEIAGVFAGLLWSLWPPSLFSYFGSDRIYTEGLGAFFLLTGIAFVGSLYANDSIAKAIAAGLLLGLSALSRGYAIFVIPAVVLFLMFRPGNKRWRQIALLTLAATAVIGGWVLRNWVELGRPLLSTQTEPFYLGNNAWARGSMNGDVIFQGYDAPQFRVVRDRNPRVLEMTEVERADMWNREALAAIRSNPRHFCWLLWRKTAVFWGPFQDWGVWWYRWHYPWTVALILAIVGTVLAFRTKLFVCVLMLWLAPLAVYLAALLAYPTDRYRFVIEPFIVFLGSLGLLLGLQALGGRRQKRMNPVEYSDQLT